MYVEWEMLPRKTISSGGLFFNDEGSVLIVKPNYKEGWNIPGGTIDAEESPVEAYMREVKEEIGLDKKPLELLCVDYVKVTRGGHDHVSMVFDGGTLTAEEISKIKLQTEELTEYKLVSIEEAVKLLAVNLSKRLPKCVEARKAHRTAYLENGEVPN